MAILLVRHGETLGNRHRVVQTPDTALSEHGLAQAAELGRRLADLPVAEIWTSPQTRARMTAAAIEAATGLAAREESDLEERSFGAIRGTAYADLGFDLMAPEYDPPEGESWATFHDRVDRIWARIEAHWFENYCGESAGEPAGGSAAPNDGARHFVVVSHGLVCRSLIERRLLPGSALDEHRDEKGRLHLLNTALTRIEPRVAGKAIVDYAVPLVGCVAHLDALEPPAVDADAPGAV